jgi:hypothetical protein
MRFRELKTKSALAVWIGESAVNLVNREVSIVL